MGALEAYHAAVDAARVALLFVGSAVIVIGLLRSLPAASAAGGASPCS